MDALDSYKTADYQLNVEVVDSAPDTACARYPHYAIRNRLTAVTEARYATLAEAIWVLRAMQVELDAARRGDPPSAVSRMAQDLAGGFAGAPGVLVIPQGEGGGGNAGGSSALN